MIPSRGVRAILALGLLLVLVAGTFVAVSSRGVAQDDPPGEGDAEGRPASIVVGGCDDEEPGEAIALLSDLTPAEGDEVGQENPAGLAETSFTTVALTLDEILADDHAVVAQLAADDDAAIACGEIGGVLDATGSLAVGLREQNGSGFTGIAFFADADDGATTNVSLFVAGTVDAVGGAADTDAATPAAAPGATPVVVAAVDAEPTDEVEAQTVDVSLTEFAIDLETTLEAGPIVFNVANDGTIRHNLEIEGEGIEASLSKNLQPGESDTLEVDLTPGTYTLYCPVGRHRDQGMEIELTVE